MFYIIHGIFTFVKEKAKIPDSALKMVKRQSKTISRHKKAA